MLGAAAMPLDVIDAMAGRRVGGGHGIVHGSHGFGYAGDVEDRYGRGYGEGHSLSRHPPITEYDHVAVGEITIRNRCVRPAAVMVVRP
jgi:hypothetical protein